MSRANPPTRSSEHFARMKIINYLVTSLAYPSLYGLVCIQRESNKSWEKANEKKSKSYSQLDKSDLKVKKNRQCGSVVQW